MLGVQYLICQNYKSYVALWTLCEFIVVVAVCFVIMALYQ